jgi:DNA-binding NarL/FixJ family response regulator
MPKILLADDSESLRAALKDVLSQQQGWTIVGEATNGRSAVSLSIELKPDLIILDFLMPLMNGIAAACEILRAVPGIPIVLYTMHMSTQLEREAKKVGITKVVSKTERFDAFIEGLNEVLVKKEAPIGPLGLCATDIAAPHDFAGCQSEPPKKPDDIPPS